MRHAAQQYRGHCCQHGPVSHAATYISSVQRQQEESWQLNLNIGRCPPKHKRQKVWHMFSKRQADPDVGTAVQFHGSQAWAADPHRPWHCLGVQ